MNRPLSDNASGFWRAVCGESCSHGSESAGGKRAVWQQMVTRPPSTLLALILALKLSGPEHRNTRRHLMARMPGDAAFKYKERRPQRTAVKKIEATFGAGADALQPSC